MADEDWSSFADLIEDGAMPVFGFRVVSFLRPDGQPGMSWHREGEQVTGGRAIGDIVGAAFEMFHAHLHEQDE